MKSPVFISADLDTVFCVFQLGIVETASAPRSWSEMNYTAASMRWLSLHCRSRPSVLKNCSSL